MLELIKGLITTNPQGVKFYSFQGPSIPFWSFLQKTDFALFGLIQCVLIFLNTTPNLGSGLGKGNGRLSPPWICAEYISGQPGLPRMFKSVLEVSRMDLGTA